MSSPTGLPRVVCDGCTDGTSERLEEWIRRQPHRVRVLSHAVNRGKGYAVEATRAAIDWAFATFEPGLSPATT